MLFINKQNQRQYHTSHNARMPSTGICEATDWKLLIDQKISGIVMLNAATVSTSRPIK